MSRLDLDRVATILVESLFFGDRRTAKRWLISERTIGNYRKRLLSNGSELSDLFKHKKELFEGEWAVDIPITVRMAMDYIKRASLELDLTPEGVHAITGALKIVAEVGLTKEMIDARLQGYRYSREESTQYRQVDASSSNTE